MAADIVTVGLQGPPGPAAALAVATQGLRYSFNVKAYGAVGNGITDDTAAIQAAFNAAKDALINLLDGSHVIGGGLSSAISVHFPSGKYLLSSTLELFDYIGIYGDPGATLFSASSTIPLLRIGCYYNSISGMTFSNGRNHIVFYGVSAVYGGFLGGPEAQATSRIVDCTFRYPHGPALYQDVSQPAQNRVSASVLHIERADFAGAAFFWAGFDEATISGGNYFYDVSTVPVLKGDGKAAALFTNYDKLYVDHIEIVPNGAISDRGALFEGDGTFGGYDMRFGGEGAAVGCRLRRSNLTWNGISPPFMSNFSGHVSFDNCEMSSCAGTNWLEIYDKFPAYIGCSNIVPTLLGTIRVALIESLGIFVDSAVDAEFLTRAKAGLSIDLHGFTEKQSFRFRQGTDYSTAGGTDLTSALRPYVLQESIPKETYAQIAQARNNLFFPGIVSSDSFTTGTASANIVNDASDTSTGYTLFRKKATANEQSFSFGATTVSFPSGWGASVTAGTYVFAFWMQANFSGKMTYTRGGSAVGSADIVNSGSKYHLYWFPFEHSGSATILGASVEHIPNNGTFTVGPFSITAGVAPPKAWTDTVDSASAPTTNTTNESLIQSVYRASAIPASGTYKATDVVWNTNTSAGSPAGWVCKVGGSPGTLEPFGGAVNLAGGSSSVTGLLPPANMTDATTSTKGIVELAGDLAGTAAAPTVKALTGTAGVVAMHATEMRADAAQNLLISNSAGTHMMLFDTSNARTLMSSATGGDVTISDPGRVVGVSVNVAGSANVTLTNLQYFAQILQFTGALTGNITVFFPQSAAGDPFYWKIIRNATSGAFNLTLKITSGATSIVTTTGQVCQFYSDGAELYKVSLV